MTRFGVMKHLDVLADADLILVRREGRHRFNHLNTVPLERIQRPTLGEPICATRRAELFKFPILGLINGG